MKVFKFLLVPILFAAILVWLDLFITNGMMLLTNKPAAMDFLAFYTGGNIVNTTPTQLYNLQTQQVAQLAIDPQSRHSFLPFLNPPFVALLFSPFAKLPLLVSYGLWVTTNSILLIIFCLIACKEMQKIPSTIKWIAIIGIIFYIPVLTSLLIGQLTFILALLFFITFIYLKKNKEILAGLVFSLVLIKPHFIVIPILAFIIARRWKVCLGILFGSSVLFLLSLALVGWSGLLAFCKTLIDAAGWDNGYGIALNAQHSLQTFLLILFHGQSASVLRPYWIIGDLCIIIPLLWIWKKRIPYTSASFPFQYALMILATLLSSPHTHFHDLMLLLVVGILVGTNIQKLAKKEAQYLEISLVIGYFLIVTGYIGEIYFPVSFRSNWIFMTVLFMLILYFLLFRVLLTVRFGILHHMEELYTLTGKVETGAKRGRDLGFPTANIKIQQEIPEGIYASITTIEGTFYPGATFIGTAKTFDETESKAETYLLDFNENIYGKKVKITLYKKIRGNKKFDSVDKLVVHMKKDIKQIREFFKEENK